MTQENKKSGLDLLREPFPAHQISKLPKPTKQQTEEIKADWKKGIRCGQCGAWHHRDVVHIDYVGHAALTDRILDCDPAWNWQPVSTDENGLPKFDSLGGLWIWLTVCGVKRMGYGNAVDKEKKGGDAIKEIIGDALRNAAMRFGAALDLWHKGDLHIADQVETAPAESKPSLTPAEKSKWVAAVAYIASGGSIEATTQKYTLTDEHIDQLIADADAARNRK